MPINDIYSWWKADKKNLPQELFDYLNSLETSQSYRSSDNLTHARLYGNYDMYGLDSYSYTRSDPITNNHHKVRLNVVQSMVDTVVSKITKNKPKPTFLTDGGNWSLKTKAKNLTKFVEGVYGSCDFYQKAAMAFLDSCIFGTGAIKIFAEDSEIKAERVLIEEIKLDDVECYNGNPRQLHQVKHIHKDILKAMFPTKEHEIAIDKAAQLDSGKYHSSTAHLASRHMIKVVESWRLPSSKTAQDGRHTITIAEHVLHDEVYTKCNFPFVFFKWGTRPIGFFGQGLAEQLKGIQLEINKILMVIQTSMHLVSIPKLLIESSSKIVSSHLNNKIGGIIRYAGTPPQYATGGAIPPDLFNHLDRLYQRAYEIAGISQLSAQSSKPAGLDSGKALREFNDLETERFLSTASRYERAFLDAAEIIIDIAKDLYATDKDLKVVAKGRKFIETIKWKEVDLEEDKYLMDIFPTSSLSSTPAGRLQDVQDLISAGFIGKEEGLKLLDFPDLEGSINMLNADSNNLDKIIEKMMDKGEYISPEPYQNLENGIRKMQQAYLMFRAEGAPEERLELLRQWMEDAQGLVVKAQEQAPTATQLTQDLASQGAETAAASIAEQAQLGSEPINPIVEGAIDLNEDDNVPQ